MWFLLFEIFVLMLLAAVFGAGVTWWWMRRRFDNVTATHTLLMETLPNPETLAKLATNDELRGAVLTLNQAIAGIPAADLGPVQERVAQLERTIASIRIPAPDLNPIVERLRAIDQRLTAFNFDPISNRVAALAMLVEKGPDLGPVHSGIVNLGLAFNRLEQPVKSLEQMNARLGDLETGVERIEDRVVAMKAPDLAPLQAKLAEVHKAVGAPDFGPVLHRIEELETLVSVLDEPMTDLSPLHVRLAALDSQLGTVERQMREHIDRRTADVEEAVGAIRMPETDLSPVMGAVEALDQRVDERFDLRALENRLTSIEFGLAAVHDMLRTRNAQPAQPIVRPELPWSQRQPSHDIGHGRTRDNGREAHPQVHAQPQWEQAAFDPINGARRLGDKSNLLKEAAFGPADNLEDINGVGAVLAGMLFDIGVYYFWQVAEWSPEDVSWVDSKLAHFRGRITRDDWVRHARELAVQPGAARRPTAHR